jgi:hypothetical protein
MTKILVVARIDYTDEFDCEAFEVYNSRKEWDEYVASVDSKIRNSGPIENYFGSNESLFFERIEDLTCGCRIHEIPNEIATFLESKLKSFGTGHSAIFDIEPDLYEDEEF